MKAKATIAKKLSALLLSALIVFSSSLTTVIVTPQKAEAGIPTIDIAGLLQTLLNYVQQLSDYAEQLYQSTVVANEYVQTLKEMEQIYREYEHTLNQIEGLRDYFDDEEWKNILARVDIDFPLNPLDSHWDDWDIDIYTDDGVLDVDEVVSNAYDRMRDFPDVVKDINDLFPAGSARDLHLKQAETHFMRSREVTEQEYSAAYFKAKNDQLLEAYERVQAARDTNATESESELRTMQTLALQQDLAINAQLAQNQMMTKLLELSNQDAIDRKTKASYIYDNRMMDMLEVKKADEYEPSDKKASALF